MIKKMIAKRTLATMNDVQFNKKRKHTCNTRDTKEKDHRIE